MAEWKNEWWYPILGYGGETIIGCVWALVIIVFVFSAFTIIRVKFGKCDKSTMMTYREYTNTENLLKLSIFGFIVILITAIWWTIDFMRESMFIGFTLVPLYFLLNYLYEKLKAKQNKNADKNN
jgi:hypothetical protein